MIATFRDMTLIACVYRDACVINALFACFRDGTDRMYLKISELLTQVNAHKTPEIGNEFT